VTGLPILHVLVSFADPNAQGKITKLLENSKGKADVHIFIDSGAFTAFNIGKKINLGEYINFVYDNLKHTDVYANLDVIHDINATYENLQKMRQAGLEPMSVIHYGTSADYVAYVAKDSKIMAIGGASNVGVSSHQVFSGLVFSTAYKANPQIKIHGFGITNPTSVLAFPYYSVDSSSWSTGRFGDLRLWDPSSKTIITWGRTSPSGILNKLELLKSLLRAYDRGIKDYLDRKNMISYDEAAIKSFIQLERHCDELGRPTKIYLAALGPHRFKREGFFDYIFSPLGEFTVSASVYQKGGGRRLDSKGALYKIAKKAEKKIKVKPRKELRV
jgi:hypothetical protein